MDKTTEPNSDGRTLCLVPDELKIILDAHKQEIINFIGSQSRRRHHDTMLVKIYDWLPTHLIEYGYKSAINSEKIKCVVKDKNLDSISVIEKYLYHVPGRCDKLSDWNYVTISISYEKTIANERILNAKHMEQLYALTHYIKHYNLNFDGFLVEDNSIKIFDTSEYAMPDEKIVKILNMHYLFYGNGKLNSPISKLKEMFRRNRLSEAGECLEKLITEGEEARKRTLDRICTELEMKPNQIVNLTKQLMSLSCNDIRWHFADERSGLNPFGISNELIQFADRLDSMQKIEIQSL